jgi:hypothetical protein
MVFNVTFNNISVISWQSVLLVEETGVPGEKPPTCRKSLTNFITLFCIEKYTNLKAWREYFFQLSKFVNIILLLCMSDFVTSALIFFLQNVI